MRYLIVVLVASCAPKMQIPVEQIPKLQNLDQVMHVQATYADPQFKKIGTAVFTDPEWTQLADLSVRIQATSNKAKEFSRDPGFTELASRLNANAAELGAATQAKNSGHANAALEAMRTTCRECHKKYK